MFDQGVIIPSEFLISRKQTEKLIAINKLLNVAKYLNDGWKPDWNDYDEIKYTFSLHKGKVHNTNDGEYTYAIVYFKSEALLEKARKILGKETIKLALSTDW